MTDREALAALLHQRYAGALCISDQDLHEWSECENTRQWKEDARFLAAGVTLTPSLDEGLREERFGDDVMAALRLRLIRGATDATYTPREVAEMVSHVIEKQVRRLAQEGETPT